MADDESGGHGGNPLTNPKNKKMVAVGVGVVGVLVAYLLYSRGKRNAAVTSPNATNTPVYTTATSAGVTPGQVADAMSPADYLAQFANTIAATQGQMNTQWAQQINGLQGQINKLPTTPVVNVVDNDTTPQPGTPPPAPPPPPPDNDGPPSGFSGIWHGSDGSSFVGTSVTVLPWDMQTPDSIAGHPWQSTLWGIGQHYHEDWPTIWAANPQIANPNIIHPGDIIKVPNA